MKVKALDFDNNPKSWFAVLTISVVLIVIIPAIQFVPALSELNDRLGTTGAWIMGVFLIAVTVLAYRYCPKKFMSRN